MDRIFQMILNRLMGQLINRGINAGIKTVVARGRPADPMRQTASDPAEQMTPEDRKAAQEARRAGQRAKQAAKVARNLMR